MKSQAKFTSFARVLFAEAPEAAPKVPKMSVPHGGRWEKWDGGGGSVCCSDSVCCAPDPVNAARSAK